MKVFLSFISTVLVYATSLGQDYSKTLIDSFCNSTIKYYYTEIPKPKDSLKAVSFNPRNHLILKSDVTQGLRTLYGQFIIHFLTQQEALEKICLTKDRRGVLDKITVVKLHDTIDIDISGWTVKVTSFKIKNGRPTFIHSIFAAGCGGTSGYIPTCRFVFDYKESIWIRSTSTEIVEAKKNSQDQ